MTGKSPNCYDLTSLEQFLNEQLDEHDELTVMDHINGCKQCQRALENIAANGGTWDDLKFHLANHFNLDPSNETIAIGERGRDRDLEMERLQAYMGPTDDPDMLGRLGSYEVCGLVGRGSTGVVVKALEPRLNRYVAIKVLSPSFASNGPARKRFEREARSVAAVSHEHVVPIFAVDEYQGLPFLVMQYIPGGSLLQRIENRGPLDSTEVIRIAMQIAKGLAAAHEQGIVHRDVKPANVMLESKVDRAMVSDFGLARVADEAAMTRSGVIAGTPQYMSPEQAKGEPIDQRSDLFSLGSVMYHAATGRPPFRAETVFGVIQRVCMSEPRPVREINPKIEPWLEGFICKLHSKDRKDRFETAEEVAEILSRELAYLQGPVSPLPDRAWYKRTKTGIGLNFSRKTWFAIATSLVALAALGITLMQGDASQRGKIQSANQGNQGVLANQQSENYQQKRMVISEWPVAPRNFARASRLRSRLNSESGAMVIALAKAQERLDMLVDCEGEDLVERTITRSFPIVDGGVLKASIDEGAFTVVAGDYERIGLELTRLIASKDEKVIQEIINNHVFEYERSENELALKAKYIGDRSRNDAFRGARLRLLVPRNHNVELDTESGMINVQDLDGALVARSHAGSMQLQNLAGSVDAETGGGAISIFDCTNIKAVTGGGLLAARFLTQPTADCVLESCGGSIRVGISPDINLKVQSHTDIGKINYLDQDQGQDFMLGQDGPLLRINTSAGNVDHYFIVDEDSFDWSDWSDVVSELREELSETWVETWSEAWVEDCDDEDEDCGDKCDEECRDDCDDDCDDCEFERKPKNKDVDSASELDLDSIIGFNDFAGIRVLQELEERKKSQWLVDESVHSAFEFAGEKLTKAVQPGGRLVVHADIGSIEITTTGEQQVTFSWSARVMAEDQAEADRLFAMAGVTMSTEEFELDPSSDAGFRLYFDEEFKKQNGLQRFRNVRLVVIVPEKFGVVSHTSAGSLIVPDIDGDVELRTSGGNISMGEISGQAIAHTSGGNLELSASHNKAELETSGGSIEIRRVMAETLAETSGGHITLGMISAPVIATTSGGHIHANVAAGIDGDIQLNTSAGGVEIGLARKGGFHVFASTSLGSVDGPFIDRKTSKVEADVNGGGTNVRVQTSVGSIKFVYVDDIP